MRYRKTFWQWFDNIVLNALTLQRADEQWSGFTPRVNGPHTHGLAHSVTRTGTGSTTRIDEAMVHRVGAFPISSSRLIGQLSMSRSLASSGFCFFFIALLSLCLCCCWLWLFRVVVLRRVSIRTLSEPFVALCRLGSEGEVDAAIYGTAL